MKNLIIFMILVVLINSCDKDLSRSQKNNFYIIGNVDHIFDSTQVYLKVQEFNKIRPLDTAYVINSTFQFKGNINKPEIFGIYIDSLKGSIGLFIQNDSIIIDVNKNKLENSIIGGSKLNDQYLSYVKKSNEILSKINYLFPLFQKARTENDVDKIIEINQKMNIIQDENRRFILNYAMNNANTYIAAVALHSVLNDTLVSKDTLALIYNNFSHEVKKGDFAIEILLYLENNEVLEKIKN